MSKQTVTIEVDVPDWSSWVACDSSGGWYAYEAEPIETDECFLPKPGTKWTELDIEYEAADWRQSKRRRPM